MILDRIHSSAYKYIKTVVLLSAIFLLSALTSCTGPQQAPGPAGPVESRGDSSQIKPSDPPKTAEEDALLRADISLMKDQLSAATKKLEELYHRISVIQFMLDNHERSIRDLETRLETFDAEKSPLDRSKPLTTETKPAGKVFEESLPEKNKPMEEPLSTEPSLTDVAEKTDTPADEINDGFIDIPPKNTTMKYTSPENLYDRALAEYRNGNFDEAVDLFKTFLTQFQDHELSDNALYWIGECLYSQKKYEAAVETFKKVVESYPNGSKVPDSYLKIGYSYLGLNDIASGRIFLKRVIQNYPFHPAGAKAEEKLRQLNAEE